VCKAGNDDNRGMSKLPQHLMNEGIRPETGDQELTTQINNRDREHLQAFSADHKAQVMKKIGTRAPTCSTVYQGKNAYEKAVLNIHRDGYELIDMQPHASVFTTLWLRKDRSFLSKGADVTMLLWEDAGDGVDGDSTTISTWRI
jgi:hypothetical protein